MSKIAPLNTSLSNRSDATDIGITVSADLSPCRSRWIALQEQGVTTVFQSFEWIEAWQDNVGAQSGVQPVIVTGTRSDGTTAFILPFGLMRKWGTRILTWLSSPHANYGCALFDREFLENEAQKFPDLWRRILDVLPRLDAIVLSDQPACMKDFVNPFSHLKSCASADRSHVLDLKLQYDALLLDKFSSRSRRRMAQHNRQLANNGAGVKRQALRADDLSRVSSAMFEQKRQQLKTRGIPDPFDTAFESFFHAFVISGSDERRSIRCYYVEYDGEIVATNFGAVQDGVYYGLITTMDEGRLDQLSPGSMTMNFAIERSCAEGLTGFDFSGGEADYKSRWSDRTVELFESHIALSVRGRVFCLTEWLRVWLKRRIKNSPTLWQLVQKARLVRRHLSGGAAVL